jgi:hypothetical protein
MKWIKLAIIKVLIGVSFVGTGWADQTTTLDNPSAAILAADPHANEAGYCKISGSSSWELCEPAATADAPEPSATPAQPAATASAQPSASDNCSAKGDVEACKLYLQEVGPEMFKGVMDLANHSCYNEDDNWIHKALECRWARAMQRAIEQPTAAPAPAAPRQQSMLKAMAGPEDSSAFAGFMLAFFFGIPLLVLFKLLRRRSR